MCIIGLINVNIIIEILTSLITLSVDDYSNQVFKLACKGKHLRVVKFLISTDSSSIVLDEEDTKLLVDCGIDLWVEAVKAKLRIKWQRFSEKANILSLIQKDDNKVGIFINIL